MKDLSRVGMVIAALGLGTYLAACDEFEGLAAKRRWDDMIASQPCKDETSLVATTAGSPNAMRCSHPQHRMRVQVSTATTPEEMGAIVFCECQRPSEQKEDRDK